MKEDKMEATIPGTDAREIVDAYFDAQNRHDTAGIAALFDADSVYVDSTMTASIRGDALAVFFTETFTSFPNISYTVNSVTESKPGRFTVKWRMCGKNSGPLQGSQPTRRDIDVAGSNEFVIENSIIRSARTYFDYGSMLRQLGQM